MWFWCGTCDIVVIVGINKTVGFDYLSISVSTDLLITRAVQKPQLHCSVSLLYYITVWQKMLTVENIGGFKQKTSAKYGYGKFCKFEGENFADQP